jgi:hypothetical protein
LATLFRLPTWARPTHYKITASVSVPRRAFVGRVRIRLAVSRPTRRLYLNAKGLELTNLVVQVKGSSGGDLLAAKLGDVDEDLGVCRSDLLYNFNVN